MTDIDKCRERLLKLSTDLDNISRLDPEQEVRGMAVPVLDAVISEARGLLKDDPVAKTISDVISIEAIEAGEPVRAVDALVLVNQLCAALPPPARTGSRILNPDVPPRRRRGV